MYLTREDITINVRKGAQKENDYITLQKGAQQKGPSLLFLSYTFRSEDRLITLISLKHPLYSEKVTLSNKANLP